MITALSLVSALLATPETSSRAGLAAIELSLVDADATHYGTFQSHNQKVTSHDGAIFMTHIRSRDEAYRAQTWRLSRSRDGGRSFDVLHEATGATSAPALEVDARGDLFLAHPDFVDRDAYLLRFRARDGHAPLAAVRLPGGGSGKYCLLLDAARAQLYYLAHDGIFHVVGVDGERRRTLRLLRDGDNAILQYPHLSLTDGGDLYAAWTTQKRGVYLYWDIHCMRSSDGGASWTTLDDDALEPPIVVDDTGPTERITLDDEFGSHTWLASLLVKDDFLHFLYLAQMSPPRQHHVRYRLEPARRDVDHSPELRGGAISLRGLDGFFATSPLQPRTTIYCVSSSADSRRIACLASDDDGASWYDYAVSSELAGVPYAIGGGRALSEDGFVIGSFTEQTPPGKDPGAHPARVHFFRIAAGRSSAIVRSVDHDDGRVTVGFDSPRGQPARARVGGASGQWSDWSDFGERVRWEVGFPPTRYQLESRLGTVSPPHSLETASPTTQRSLPE